MELFGMRFGRIGATSMALCFVVLSVATNAFAVCGDVTGDQQITASDALSVLNAAVGLPIVLICDGPVGSTTTTTLAGPASHSLTVTKKGDGNGHVSSVPAGINCGNACQASFADGTKVTVSAAPNTGASFEGWSGQAACNGSITPCTLTMGRDRSIAATFVEATTTTTTTTTMLSTTTMTAPPMTTTTTTTIPVPIASYEIEFYGTHPASFHPQDGFENYGLWVSYDTLVGHFGSLLPVSAHEWLLECHGAEFGGPWPPGTSLYTGHRRLSDHTRVEFSVYNYATRRIPHPFSFGPCTFHAYGRAPQRGDFTIRHNNGHCNCGVGSPTNPRLNFEIRISQELPPS